MLLHGWNSFRLSAANVTPLGAPRNIVDRDPVDTAMPADGSLAPRDCRNDDGSVLSGLQICAGSDHLGAAGRDGR